MPDAVESLASRFEVLKPHLNERQRRLWLGAEARELGSGGVGIVAQAVGVAGDTVRRGRAELEEPAPLPYPRSRKPGGGRKRAEAGDPTLVAALDKLVDPVTRGDPMSPLRWTSKSLRTLAKALQEQGHQVSEQIVRRLLREAGYSLQGNAKTLEGGQHPDRDGQFIYLADQAAEHLGAGAPVVSVDAKKKELVGQFKNGGQDYHPAGSPVPVNVHDFLDPALGKAIPYGVYDIGANSGWVSVGSDHDRHARQHASEQVGLVAGLGGTVMDVLEVRDDHRIRRPLAAVAAREDAGDEALVRQRACAHAGQPGVRGSEGRRGGDQGPDPVGDGEHEDGNHHRQFPRRRGGGSPPGDGTDF